MHALPSKFSVYTSLPEDPIFGISHLFQEDSRPHKVNLGIGSYKDRHGLPVVLKCVREAEVALQHQHLDKEYLPIEGWSPFNIALTDLVFGAAYARERTFSIQTVGGTSALFLGGELLRQHIAKQIYLPTPTWANHLPVFQHAGMEVDFYPYADLKNQIFDFEGMCHSIRQMVPGTAILLQAACHNPTGIDPTQEQWQQLSRLIRERNIFPLFDVAYQGFGVSLDEDAYPIRLFAQEGHEMLVAVSCAKNFGLYGERAGMLTVLCAEPSLCCNVSSHLKRLVRSTYSNPPLHGGRIVGTILNTPELAQQWREELNGMRERIASMRRILGQQLHQAGKEKQAAMIIGQRGMFSCLGLSDAQVDALRTEYAIYLVGNGRLNVAGLNEDNVNQVADALRQVWET